MSVPATPILTTPVPAVALLNSDPVARRPAAGHPIASRPVASRSADSRPVAACNDTGHVVGSCAADCLAVGCPVNCVVSKYVSFILWYVDTLTPFTQVTRENLHFYRNNVYVRVDLAARPSSLINQFLASFATILVRSALTAHRATLRAVAPFRVQTVNLICRNLP